ncbi:conjugal transfer protein TraN [Desulfurobacterium crinifex]
MKKLLTVLTVFSFTATAYALTGSFFQDDREYGLTDEFYPVSEIDSLNGSLPEGCELLSCDDALTLKGELNYSADYFFCDKGVIDNYRNSICSIVDISGQKYVECNGSFLDTTSFRAFVSCPIFSENATENGTDNATPYLDFTPDNDTYYCAKDINETGFFDDPSEIQQCIEADNGNGYVCPIDKVSCEATYEEPLCPEGTLNTERDMCQADPLEINCPAGYTWDSSLDKCVITPTCPEGGVFNPATDRCEKQVINECPDGYNYDQNRDVCYKDVTCPSGTTYNPSTDRCEKDPIYLCPAGYTYNYSIDKCEMSPSCPSGTTYNSERNRCEKSLGECPEGYTYNAVLDKCVRSVECPDGGTLNPNTDKCELAATPVCPDGWTLNESTGKCEKAPVCSEGGTYNPTYNLCLVSIIGIVCPTGYSYSSTYSACIKSPYCPAGSVYNKNTDRCESVPSYECPDGWSLNSDTGLCERVPICPEGTTYNSQRNRCEKSLESCPEGYSYNAVLDKCVKAPECPEGGTLDTETDKCEVQATTFCPAGYTLNTNTNKCEAEPICPEGSTLDKTNDVCLIAVENTYCPFLYKYSSTYNKCIKSVYCSGGYYNKTTNRCEATPKHTCPTGYTYNSSTGKCEKDPECPSGMTYSNSLNRCIAFAQTQCPSGYTYNSSTGRCEANPTCPSGFTYNSVTNRCESSATVNYNCPSGTSYNSSTGKCEAAPDSQSDSVTASVSCSSWGYNYNECSVDGIDEIKSVKLKSQASDAACRTAYTADTGTVLCSSQTTEAPTPGSCSTFDPKTLWWCNSCSSSYNWLTGETTYTCNNCQYGIVPQNSYYYYGYFGCSECEEETHNDWGWTWTNYKCSSCQSYWLVSWATTFGITSDRKKIWVNSGCRGTFEINGSGCPIGYTHYTSSNICVKCPTGTTYNSSTGKCEANPSTTYSCPSGSTLSGSLCIANPSCPSGGTFDGNADVCYTNPSYSCSVGIYDSSSGYCVANAYCGEGTLNTITDKCEAEDTLSCPSGYTLSGNICYKSVYCYQGTLDPDIDYCVAEPTFVCPDGFTYSSTYNACYKAPSCPLPGSYNSLTDKCESSYFYTDSSCPSGYTRVGDVCQANPVCSSPGSYSSSSNLCIVSENLCGDLSFDSSNDICYTSADCQLGVLNTSIDKCQLASTPTCASGFTLEGDVCYISAQCSEGTLDTSIDYCKAEAQFTCPTGYSYSSTYNSCYKTPDCGSGSLNPTSDVCQLAYTLTCPSTYSLSGTICQLTPTCLSPGSYNADINLCDAGNNLCGSFSFDGNNDVCYTPAECGNGGTLNTERDMCETAITGVDCGGYTYDSSTKTCYTLDNYCEDNSYDSSYNQCIATVGKNCGTYSLSSENNQLCIKEIECPTDSSFSLSDTISYSSVLDKCVSDAEHICPSGDTYVYTWNKDVLKCELVPICANGVYTPETDGCYVGDLTCPVGDYPCLPIGGENYCSPNPCERWSDALEYDDTPEGINDKQADGEIDENGNCLGTIYIFNGRDKRCRPPGLQTGGSDCCRKTTTWFGLGMCKESEKILAKLRSWGQLDGQCHYIGSYCAVKVLGVCLQRKKTYCCFNSVLARIIQEQGRPQLGIGWGDAKHPNCRGFTPEEFQKIDFSKIDFSEWLPEIEQNVSNTISNVQSQIEGAAQTIQDYYQQ